MNIEYRQHNDDNSITVWNLVDEHDEHVAVGAVRSSSARQFRVTGGKPPQHGASTGRVHGCWVESGEAREFFPSVFSCKWIVRQGTATENLGIASSSTAIDDAIDDAIERKIEARLDAAIEAKLDAAIEAKLDAAIEARLDVAMEDRLDDAIEAAVDIKIEDSDFMTFENFIEDYGDEMRTASRKGLNSLIESVVEQMIQDRDIVLSIAR